MRLGTVTSLSVAVSVIACLHWPGPRLRPRLMELSYMITLGCIYTEARWRLMQISIDSKQILSASVSGSENEPLVWTSWKSHHLYWFISLGLLALMLQELLPSNVSCAIYQGFHSDWKTWKNGEAFYSQGILNRLEKSEKITQNTGKVREFWTDWKSQGKWHKILENTVNFRQILFVIF